MVRLNEDSPPSYSSLTTIDSWSGKLDVLDSMQAHWRALVQQGGRT